jgi:hypothetical protein
VPSRMLPSLARLADLVHRLQAHAPALWRADVGGFRASCPVSDTTAAWLQRDAARSPAPWELLIRPDIGLEADARGGLTPVLFETNATGLAGLYNHAAGVRILRAEVFPRVYTAREARALTDPPDLLALVVRWVRAAARHAGPAAPAGGRVRGGCPASRWLQRGAAASSRPSARRGSPPPRGRWQICAEPGTACASRPHGRHGLPGSRARGHRAADAAGARRLPRSASTPARACRAYRASSPTRRCSSASGGPNSRPCSRWRSTGCSAGPCPGPACSERGTRRTRPVGRSTSRSSCGRARERLLIKPNVGSSGSGLLLGLEAGPARWEARIARAVREPGRWVVQLRRPGTVPPDGLPPERPRPHGPLLLLAGALLRAGGSRAPLPGEPGARCQRRAAGRRRLRVSGRAANGRTRLGSSGHAGAGCEPSGPSGGTAAPSRHSGAGPYFISIFLAMAT